MSDDRINHGIVYPQGEIMIEEKKKKCKIFHDYGNWGRVEECKDAYGNERLFQMKACNKCGKVKRRFF